MDERTREKYLRACRVMVHLLEGHSAPVPRHISRTTLCMDGLRAAHELVRVFLTRESESEAVRIQAKIKKMKATTVTPEAKKPVNTALCEHCHRPYRQVMPWQKYCSESCSRQARRERAEKRAAAAAAVEPTLLNHCDRLHVTTMQPLPCGKREECFGENPCQFVPDRKQRASGSQWTKPIPVPSPLVREAFGIGCGLPAGDM